MAEAGKGEGNDANNTTDWQKKIEVERAHAQAAKTELDELKQKFKDIDPDKYSSALSRIAELDRKSASDSKDPKAIEALIEAGKQEERERLGKELRERDDKINTLFSEVKTVKVINVGLEEAGRVFVKGALPWIKVLIEKHADIEDGNIIIKDDKGKVRFSPKDATAKMTMKEFIQELQANNEDLVQSTFKKTSHNAGEHTSNGSNGSGPSVADYLKMTPEQAAKIPAKERGDLALKYFRQGNQN